MPGCRSKRFSSVVLPLPRKPVMSEAPIGSFGRGVLMGTDPRTASVVCKPGPFAKIAERREIPTGVCRMSESVSNMKLLAHDELGGFGNVGEGMSLQLAKGGRRILWLAHESAPKNFTAVEVTDPRKPKVILQQDLPHRQM